MLNFGFNFGKGAGGLAEFCIVVMGTSGDWRGHIAGTGSVITPGYTYMGLDIYEYKWNVVTARQRTAFGAYDARCHRALKTKR